MYFHPIQSDQLYTWSDIHEEPTGYHLEKTAPNPCAPTAPTPVDPARLFDRALQALWQAGVQVRRWSRPRTQVLSFREPSAFTATNGLCAAGVSRSDFRVPRQLSPNPRDLRSDLGNQSRTAAPAGDSLRNRHERTRFGPYLDRCWIGRRAPGQYGRSLVGCEPSRLDQCGGSQ